MSDMWATSGLDLHLALDRSRVRRSLEERLRASIQDGRLPPGTVLPSSRALAADLQVARNTVVEVYGELVAEGWLAAQSGSRTVVADLAPRRAMPLVPEPAVARQYARLGSLDLRPGWPDLSAFPRRGWLRATQRALATAPSDAFGYQEPRGRPELREPLAGYLARTRGLRVSADQILVCLGISHGLGLVASALRARGATTFGVEDHSLWVHHQILSSRGLRLTHLPVDADGARLDRGSAGADAVLLTPGHQFPMGGTLSDERRQDFAGWAGSRGRVVFEDDYEGEFSDADAPGALQPMAPDHVVYAGTTSKTLAPGLRLGWLVLPPGLLDLVASVRGLAEGHNSIIDQLALAQYISTGDYDRHIRGARRRYRHRREQLAQSLGWGYAGRLVGAQRGLHTVLTLPEGVTEAQVVALGHRHGLTLQGLGDFRAPFAAPRPPALVVGYAGVTDRDYPACLSRLSEVLHRL